jgi:Lipocalin-like domain
VFGAGVDAMQRLDLRPETATLVRLKTIRRNAMRGLFAIFILIWCGSLSAAEADNLIGVWKLVSWQVIVENQPPKNVFGSHPKGFLILTRDGRSMALTTAENRQAGLGESEQAALHRSMLAYSGKFRVEGNDFITVVDISWNEAWNGTEQRRHFRLQGDKFFIESAPAPSIVSPGKIDFRRIVWEREK